MTQAWFQCLSDPKANQKWIKQRKHIAQCQGDSSLKPQAQFQAIKHAKHPLSNEKSDQKSVYSCGKKVKVGVKRENIS